MPKRDKMEELLKYSWTRKMFDNAFLRFEPEIWMRFFFQAVGKPSATEASVCKHTDRVRRVSEGGPINTFVLA